jgi:hypothetical protein
MLIFFCVSVNISEVRQLQFLFRKLSFEEQIQDETTKATFDVSELSLFVTGGIDVKSSYSVFCVFHFITKVKTHFASDCRLANVSNM